MIDCNEDGSPVEQPIDLGSDAFEPPQEPLCPWLMALMDSPRIRTVHKLRGVVSWHLRHCATCNPLLARDLAWEARRAA